jgi:Calpain family cysteine protease
VDWITLFRNSQDDAVVSADELTDFNTILTNSSRWTITDDVKTLSKKLLSTDKANLTFQGATLGVLTAGSGATQMENLIGKWFLGLDRPTPTSTSYSYRSISGSLFQNGISTTDIKQGQVGDCYFLSTLGSIAHEQPNYIQNMFIDNGDNTWTVRFNNSGKWDYVTVDRFLPTNSSGNLVYASQGSNFANTANELWVALAEKAYAQIGESGWTRGTNRTNSYASIESGWMTYVINQVTGLNSTWNNVKSLAEQTVITWVNSNAIVTLGTGSTVNYGLVGGHAYAITSYNATNGTFFVRNPWGTQHVELTWTQLTSLDLDLAYSV